MSDDGLGLEVLRRLEETCRLPEGVDLLDGGTLGLDLLAHVEGYGGLLVADCVTRSGAPGTVYRIPREDVEATFEGCLSPHQVGLQDLISILELQGRLPGRLTVIGVEPESLEVGLGLSPSVQASVDEAVRCLVDELASWGVAVEAVGG